MSELVVIDTDILIDAARQIDEAVECLHRVEDRSMLAVSVITYMELVVGCRDKAELGHTESFLQRFHLLRLSEPVCDAALELLRRYPLSHGLMIPDALIAATAIVLDYPFLSKNQRHYRFINRLQLLPYPTAAQ